MVRLSLRSILLLCAVITAAQSPATPTKTPPPLQDFPLILQQRIVAGQTPVGTSVDGKLVIATLVRGGVLPAGTVFKGRVEESSAKAATSPSRLRIHLTTAEWGGRPTSVDLYLTNAFYRYPEPPSDEEDTDPRRGADDRAIDRITATLRRQSRTSIRDVNYYSYPQRTVMEDVRLDRASGAVSLVCSKNDVRIDRLGIYSFEGSVTSTHTGN